MKMKKLLLVALFFLNLNAKKVIFWCTNSSQIEELSKNPNKPYSIMGETIVFWSLFEALNELGFEVINIKSKEELQQQLNVSVHKIVTDIYCLEKTAQELLSEKYVDKLYLVDYWGCNEKTFNERKHIYQRANKKLSLSQFLTPFNYKNQNQFLGFVINQQASKGIRKQNFGIYWGKFLRYINSETAKFLSGKKIKMKANLASKKISLPANIENYGLVARDQYHKMLSESLFLLGSGDPKAGPSILEALLYSCFVVAPKRQIPEQLHSNPGIILTDTNNKKETLKIVKKIINKELVFPINSFPKEFTKEEHLRRVARLFDV